jgi:hypothetical protein
MTLPFWRWRAARLVASSLLFVATVRAQVATSEPVRMEVRSELPCGSAERFLRSVFARTPLARKPNEGESARTFHVSIHPGDDGRFSGELVVTDASKPAVESGRRVIAGESCIEVFDALALFAALSVDPRASTAALPEEVPGAIETPPVSREVASASPPVPPSPQAPSPTPARTDERKPRSRGSAWQARGGGHVGIMSAGLRSGLLLVMPFVEGSYEAAPETVFAFAPAGRLWFSSTDGSTHATVEGPARMVLTTARLDACPLEIRLLSTLYGRPCLVMAGGALSARGETITYPARVRLPWASLGGSARVEWRLLGFLALEAAAGVDLPLVRHAFHFEPATPIYRVPAVLPNASAGLSLEFL